VKGSTTSLFPCCESSLTPPQITNPPSPHPSYVDSALPGLVLVAYEEFVLPSEQILEKKGFNMTLKDPYYKNIGAIISPGAWPLSDRRRPSISVYWVKENIEAISMDKESGAVVSGLLLEMQPSPISFRVPVTVVLPVDNPSMKYEYSAAVFDPSTTTWTLKPPLVYVSKPFPQTSLWINGSETMVDGKVHGSTMGFSLYAALSWPKKPPACNTDCIILSVIGSVVGALFIGYVYYVKKCVKEEISRPDADQAQADEEQRAGAGTGAGQGAQAASRATARASVEPNKLVEPNKPVEASTTFSRRAVPDAQEEEHKFVAQTQDTQYDV